MLKYNWQDVPDTINPKMVISAFENMIDYDKVEQYTEVMQSEYDFEYTFPPILWYPSIITEDMVDNEDMFLSGDEITSDLIGKACWMVTDWHHRTLAAVNSWKTYIDVELDRTAITDPLEVEAFDLIYN